MRSPNIIYAFVKFAILFSFKYMHDQTLRPKAPFHQTKQHLSCSIAHVTDLQCPLEASFAAPSANTPATPTSSDRGGARPGRWLPAGGRSGAHPSCHLCERPCTRSSGARWLSAARLPSWPPARAVACLRRLPSAKQRQRQVTDTSSPWCLPPRYATSHHLRFGTRGVLLVN